MTMKSQDAVNVKEDSSNAQEGGGKKQLLAGEVHTAQSGRAGEAPR